MPEKHFKLAWVVGTWESLSSGPYEGSFGHDKLVTDLCQNRMVCGVSKTWVLSRCGWFNNNIPYSLVYYIYIIYIFRPRPKPILGIKSQDTSVYAASPFVICLLQTPTLLKGNNKLQELVGLRHNIPCQSSKTKAFWEDFHLTSAHHYRYPQESIENLQMWN